MHFSVVSKSFAFFPGGASRLSCEPGIQVTLGNSLTTFQADLLLVEAGRFLKAGFIYMKDGWVFIQFFSWLLRQACFQGSGWLVFQGF